MGKTALRTLKREGSDPTREAFAVEVSETQLGKQLGNTMSVNVLERLLVRVLPAAGLVKHGVLSDRWENGDAVKQLSCTRNRGFKKILRPLLKRNSSSSESALADSVAKKRARMQ